jgi:hypothetical protein
VAKGLVYYVPGAVVWKSQRTAAADLLLSTYGVVAGRRVVGDAELNPPSEPEYVLLDKYIYNKEAARIETRRRRQNRQSEMGLRIPSRSLLPRLDELQQQLLNLQQGALDRVNPLRQLIHPPSQVVDSFVCLVDPRR